MSNSDVILAIVSLAAFLGSAVFLVWLIVSLGDSYVLSKNLSKFKQDLSRAIKKSQPSWEQVKIISSINSLNEANVNKVLRELLVEALKDSDEKLKAHADLIESYLQSHNKDQPFEDLPDEIRVQLERLGNKLSDKPGILEPLADQLRDFSTKKLRERKRQKLWSIISLVIGIAGLVVGVLPFLISQPK